MLMWLQLALLPRRLATVIGAVLLSGTIVLLLWLNHEQGSVVGRVQEIAEIGNGNTFLRVRFPLDPTTTPAIVADSLIQSRGVKLGDWVLMTGGKVTADDRQIFRAQAVASFPASQLSLLASGNWERRLAETPIAAILLGCVVLIAGGLITGLVTAILFATLGAVFVWHAVYAAAFFGWIDLPPFSVTALVAAAAITSLALGWRSAGLLGSTIWPRLTAAALLYLLLPTIAARFGWPEALAYALVVASLALPVIAYACIGGFLMHVGLNPQEEGALVVLLASAATAVLNELLIKPRLWPGRPVTGQFVPYSHSVASRV